ncbi:MAG TPA: hypothetical protein VI653_11125 [Steroidobacteraceae bacterium]
MSPLKQQINLYQPVADATRAPFSIRTAMLLAVVTVVGIVSIWGYGAWRVQRLAKTVTLLQEQQQHQTQTLEALTSARAAKLTPEQLEARISALAAEIALHSHALALLRSGAAGQTTGFSQDLSALARHSVEGLWIHRVDLSGIGEPRMSLNGVAIDPTLVPGYLHDLRAEPALAGLRFDVFTIERPTSSHDTAPESRDKFVFKAESGAVAATTADSRS